MNSVNEKLRQIERESGGERKKKRDADCGGFSILLGDLKTFVTKEKLVRMLLI